MLVHKTDPVFSCAGLKYTNWDAINVVIIEMSLG